MSAFENNALTVRQVFALLKTILAPESPIQN